MIQIKCISGTVTIIHILIIFSNINESLTEVFKKEEAVPLADPDIESNTPINFVTNDKETNIPSIENNNLTKNLLPESSFDDLRIPESVKSFYFVFMGLAAAAIIFLIYKALQLRKNRAERRYGVLGDRNGQELTPLGIDDDSDNDQTLFEINRQRS